MLARILGWSDVTGPFICPRENDTGWAQETEKHSCPWWQVRVPPFLGRHSHASHLTFLVRAKGREPRHSHSHPGNGDTRGRGSPQAGSGACPGQGWTERSGDAPCKAEADLGTGRAPAKADKRFRWNKAERGEGAEHQWGHKSRGSFFEVAGTEERSRFLPIRAQSRQADLTGDQGTHQGHCRKG